MSVDVQGILSYFDYALEKGQWPELFGGARDRAFHTMRLIAVRSSAGWGLLFERLEGHGFDGDMATPYAFGSGTENLGWVRAEPWGLSDEPFSLEDEDAIDDPSRPPFAIEGLEAIGPQGTLLLHDQMIVDHDLRPGRATAVGINHSLFFLCLRAYLVHHPRAFWRDVDEILPLLELPDDAHVVLISEAFEHCVGPDGPAQYPGAWRVKPSESRTYQSLARAIVADDASLFSPGATNLDFRLHALHDTGEGASA
jgi:hypothetical protein